MRGKGADGETVLVVTFILSPQRHEPAYVRWMLCMIIAEFRVPNSNSLYPSPTNLWLLDNKTSDVDSVLPQES
jgi:hypothetical protein